MQRIQAETHVDFFSKNATDPKPRGFCGQSATAGQQLTKLGARSPYVQPTKKIHLYGSCVLLRPWTRRLPSPWKAIRQGYPERQRGVKPRASAYRGHAIIRGWRQRVYNLMDDALVDTLTASEIAFRRP